MTDKHKDKDKDKEEESDGVGEAVHRGGARERPPRRPDALRLVADESGRPGWVFVHPRCAEKRREDMEEVESMLAAGETEIARDELVWLLSECPDYFEAHLHLAQIALDEGDVRLARGHFGRVHELGLRAIEAAASPGPVLHGPPANAAFWACTKGLVQCLVEMGRAAMARTVATRALALDPADPLGISSLVARAAPDGPRTGSGRRRRKRRGP